MNGEAPIEWPDIAAYMLATKAITERWEAVTLRDMSNAYAQGKNDGKDPMADPPEDKQEDDDEWLTSPN